MPASIAIERHKLQLEQARNADPSQYGEITSSQEGWGVDGDLKLATSTIATTRPVVTAPKIAALHLISYRYFRAVQLTVHPFQNR